MTDKCPSCAQLKFNGNSFAMWAYIFQVYTISWNSDKTNKVVIFKSLLLGETKCVYIRINEDMLFYIHYNYMLCTRNAIKLSAFINPNLDWYKVIPMTVILKTVLIGAIVSSYTEPETYWYCANSLRVRPKYTFFLIKMLCGPNALRKGSIF